MVLRVVKLGLFHHWNVASPTAAVLSVSMEGSLLSAARSARSRGSEWCWLVAAALENTSLKVKMDLRCFHGYIKPRVILL